MVPTQQEPPHDADPQRSAIAAEAGRRGHRGGAERPPQAGPRARARGEASRRPLHRGQEEDDRDEDTCEAHRRRRGVTRRRLDAELVRRGLAVSRAAAKEAVEAGSVRVAGSVAARPATMVTPDAAIDLVGNEPRPFVSRAGGKLATALDRFAIDPTGRMCLDAGASTGGFTDALLQRGANHVIAVDVGYGQLAWSIRTDERVTVLERTNVRDLTPGELPFAPDLVVADLSFISLTRVLPALTDLAAREATFVVLVKPQFEAGRGDVGSGGVVRDPAVWHRVIEEVIAAAGSRGLAARAVMASPLRGPAGNVEFLLQLGRGAEPGADVAAAVRDAMAWSA